MEHGWIVEALERRPGVVVLHEFVLHHLVSGITLARGDVEGYCAALEREAGAEGRDLGLAVQQGRIEPLWETRAQEFPLAHGVLDAATGLIVHSQYVEGLARDAGYERLIRQVPMPAWPVPPIVPEPIAGGPVIGCFGHVNESKRIPQLLEAFVRLGPDARLLLVGSWSPRLPGIELPPTVIRRDYVAEDELWRLLAACDAVVSLRWPTMGETSAAAVRALSLGKPLIVSDVGAFRELPDEVAIKVPVGEGEVDALVAAIRRAAGNREMSEAARRVAATEHGLDRTADLYAEALALDDSGGRGMKVAYYSPLPPSRSGIADYSALLLPELEKRIDVVLARPGRFRRDPQADIALYHVGNDAEAHGWIVEALRRRPGVVVLHDFVLHHLVVGLTFARGDSAGYLAAMEREGGLVGRLLAYAVLDNKLPPLWETRPEDFPLAGEVLDHATGLIVHSRYVERRARESGFRGPIARIPHPGLAAAGDPAGRCRRRAAVRLLRPPERDQAHRRARVGVRTGARAPARRAAPARRLARGAAQPPGAARRESSTASTCPRTSSGR